MLAASMVAALTALAVTSIVLLVYRHHIRARIRDDVRAEVLNELRREREQYAAGEAIMHEARLGERRRHLALVRDTKAIGAALLAGFSASMVKLWRHPEPALAAAAGALVVGTGVALLMPDDQQAIADAPSQSPATPRLVPPEPNQPTARPRTPPARDQSRDLNADSDPALLTAEQSGQRARMNPPTVTDTETPADPESTPTPAPETTAPELATEAPAPVEPSPEDKPGDRSDGSDENEQGNDQRTCLNDPHAPICIIVDLGGLRDRLDQLDERIHDGVRDRVNASS